MKRFSLIVSSNPTKSLEIIKINKRTEQFLFGFFLQFLFIVHAIQKYDPSLNNLVESSLVFLKDSVSINKAIKTSVKFGNKLFESPLCMYKGGVTPSSLESSNTPESKLKLKKATYNGISSCAVALIHSL